MPPTASGRDRSSKEGNLNTSDSFSSVDINLRPLNISYERSLDERTRQARISSLPNYSIMHTVTSPTQQIKAVASTPRDVSLRTRKAISTLQSSTEEPISSSTSGKLSGTTFQPATKPFSFPGVHCRNTGKSCSPGMCLHVRKSTIPRTYSDIGKSIPGKYCDFHESSIPGTYSDIGQSIPGMYCNAEKSIPGMYRDAENSSIPGFQCDAGKFQAPRYMKSLEVNDLKDKHQPQALCSSILHNHTQLQDVKSRYCDVDLPEERAVRNATEQSRTSCMKLLGSQKITDQKNVESSNKDILMETTVLETLGRRSALALQEEIEISHVRHQQRPFRAPCKHSPNSYNATYVPGGIANTCSTKVGGTYIHPNTTGTVTKSDGTRLITVPLLIAGEHTPQNRQVNNNRVHQRRAHSVHSDHISSVQSDATALQPRPSIARAKHPGSKSVQSNVESPITSNIIQIENAMKDLGYAENLAEGIERNRNAEFIKKIFSSSEPLNQQAPDINELSKTDNQCYGRRKKKQNPKPSNEKDKPSINQNVIPKTSHIIDKQSTDVNRSVCSSEEHKIPGKEVNEPVVEAFIIPVQKKQDIPRSLERILATLTNNALPCGNPKESSTMSGISLPTKDLTRPHKKTPADGENCAARRYSTNLQVQLHTETPKPQSKRKVSLVDSKVHTAKPSHSSVFKARVQPQKHISHTASDQLKTSKALSDDNKWQRRKTCESDTSTKVKADQQETADTHV